MTPPNLPDIEAIRQRLLAHRHPASHIPQNDAPGIYILSLPDPAALPSLTTGPDHVLFVATTESTVDVRYSFKHEHSGFSTVRRSLGALLRTKLQLNPIRRAPKSASSNVKNFRFEPESERRLTQWIGDHLEYGYAPVDHQVRDVEYKLIVALRPPLNLTALRGWRNPDIAQIRQARRECREAAAAVQTVKPTPRNPNSPVR